MLIFQICWSWSCEVSKLAESCKLLQLVSIVLEATFEASLVYYSILNRPSAGHWILFHPTCGRMILHVDPKIMTRRMRLEFGKVFIRIFSHLPATVVGSGSRLIRFLMLFSSLWSSNDMVFGGWGVFSHLPVFPQPEEVGVADTIALRHLLEGYLFFSRNFKNFFNRNAGHGSIGFL